MNASPTNSNNQKRNLQPILRKPTNSQKHQRQSSTNDEPSHNVATHSIVSPPQRHMMHQSTKSNPLLCKLIPLCLMWCILVPFLIGLGLGDSHLVIPFLYSLALFFFVISVFLCFAFPSFFVLLICWCYFAFSNFLNMHLSYLSKRKEK